MNQIKLKADFEEKVTRHPMIDEQTFRHIKNSRLVPEDYLCL